MEKTEGLLIGFLQNVNIIVEGIKFSNIIKYLGIYIGKDNKEYHAKNWDCK